MDIVNITKHLQAALLLLPFHILVDYSYVCFTAPFVVADHRERHSSSKGAIRLLY